MAPSQDFCVLCSCAFFGKQKFFRCASCQKRVHAKCVVWPDEELQLLKSGARRFRCNLCETADAAPKPTEALSASNDTGPPSRTHSSPCARRQSPAAWTPAPPSQPVDLRTEVASLHALLTDALEGISFLSDQVARLREENEQVRRESMQGFARQADVVVSLREEIRCLRGELARRPAAPRTQPCSPESKSPFSAVAAAPTLPAPAASPSPTSATAGGVQGNVVAFVPAPVTGIVQPKGRPARLQPSYGTSDPGSITVVSPKLTHSADQQPTRDVSRRPPAMFVSRLSPETTSEALSSHLTSLNAPPVTCKRLKTRFTNYASFHVVFSDEYFERLQDPSLWPNGCLFKRFLGPLHESMLHTSETSNNNPPGCA